MTVRLNFLSVKRAAPALVGLALAAAASSAMAQQQTCQADFQRLAQARMAQIQRLNAIGKAGHGKIDPMAACPAARALLSTEGAMLAYMTRNKEWCSIPDQIIQQFQQARARNQTFASQACSAAAKFKQMQEQQRAAAANGGAGVAQPQKLPAGPL
jgi:hypothetical protein